jgi:hypothetical protein
MEKGAKSRSAKSGKYKPVKKMKEIIKTISTGTIIGRLRAYLKDLYYSIICYEYNTSACMCCCCA